MKWVQSWSSWLTAKACKAAWDNKAVYRNYAPRSSVQRRRSVILGQTIRPRAGERVAAQRPYYDFRPIGKLSNPWGKITENKKARTRYGTKLPFTPRL